jgi:hypothetical protein
LQVIAVSPFLAANFSIDFLTVALPHNDLPFVLRRFFETVRPEEHVPVFVAVESTVAAGWPIIFTLLLRLPSITPVNG